MQVSFLYLCRNFFCFSCKFGPPPFSDMLSPLYMDDMNYVIMKRTISHCDPSLFTLLCCVYCG